MNAVCSTNIVRKATLATQKRDADAHPDTVTAFLRAYLKGLSWVPQILQVAAIALATLGTGAATMTVMNEDIPDLQVPVGAWTASGALDGMSFEIIGTDHNRGAVLDNIIRFRDGAFQSVDCQNSCDFGWSGYQTKEMDGVIHFTARTICPDAPHTVVWYGTVDGDEVAARRMGRRSASRTGLTLGASFFAEHDKWLFSD